jgi:HEAT repeat protein
MLSASNPVPPQDNRNAWSGASSIRFALVIGYLQHPDPKVRASAIELGVRYCGHTYGVQDRLVELAADPDSQVRLAAVSALWTVHRESSCERVVQSLRDEIRGHTNDFGLPAAGLRLGPDRARAALDLLVEHAPDEGARRGVLALIEHYIASG